MNTLIEKQMNIDDNLIICTTISDFNENYKLQALLNKDGEYDTTWLEGVDNHLISDNPKYILEKLFNTLEDCVANKTVPLFIDEILEDIPVEDFEELYKILKKGKQLGFK